MEGNNHREHLVQLVIGLLFLHADPVEMSELATWLEIREEALADILAAAQKALQATGLTVRWMGGGVALATAGDLDAELRTIAEQAKAHPEPLSQGAWETLAIIAYRQPITRLEAEAVRQAGSERTLTTLLERDLIEEVGRKETPGRPILYGTTASFLRQFGLAAISGLPPLEDGPP